MNKSAEEAEVMEMSRGNQGEERRGEELVNVG